MKLCKWLEVVYLNDEVFFSNTENGTSYLHTLQQ